MFNDAEGVRGNDLKFIFSGEVLGYTITLFFILYSSVLACEDGGKG